MIDNQTTTPWRISTTSSPRRRHFGQQLQHGEISESEEHERLRRIETELDQCWDLLRQRRALRETGGDPSDAAVRPAGEVEGYLG